MEDEKPCEFFFDILDFLSLTCRFIVCFFRIVESRSREENKDIELLNYFCFVGTKIKLERKMQYMGSIKCEIF